MVTEALLCVLVAIICVGGDRLFSWQTLQRPIVIAPITGLFLGDFNTGIVMGASLEAIFMGISAIGGSIPADASAASIIAVAMTILTGSDIETGLALAMPIGTIMAAFNELYKPILAALAPYWEKLAASGKIASMRTQVILSGVFIDRLHVYVVLFISIAFGVEGLQAAINSLPAWVMAGFSAASGMMTAVGFAILGSMIWSAEVGSFFFIGFVLAKYLGLGSLPVAIILGVVAVMYFLNDKKILDTKNELLAAGVKAVDEEEDFFA